MAHPNAALSTIDRFMMKVHPEPNSGCWLWVGAVFGGDGYGSFFWNGKRGKAHRFAFEHFHHRTLTDWREYVCHKCDTPACVNPDHLFVGTNSDNQVDSSQKGRAFQRITIDVAAKIKSMLAEGVRGTEIADHLGLEPYMVYNIKYGKAWDYVEPMLREAA